METRTRRLGAGRGPAGRGRTGPGRQAPRLADRRGTAARTRTTGLFPDGPAPPTDPPGSPDPPEPPEPPEPPGAGLSPGQRLRLAAGERCGMERRTLAALGLVLLVAAGFAVHHLWTGRPQTVVATREQPLAGPASTAVATATTGTATTGTATTGAGGGSVVIDVAGRVREPGVYTLPTGSRVGDAIEAAGGSRPGTDTGGLNRARLLMDGEQVVVGADPAAPPVASAATVPATGPAGGQVSLNSATAEQLDTLPGIGPVLAASIVQHREQSGGFTTVEQLLDVSGIGETRLAELRDHVTL